MGIKVSDAHNEIMELVDKLGAPPMSKESYIELLEEVENSCAVRREATQQELDNE